MIAIQSNYLFFQLASGESVPCSAEMISVELVGNAKGMLDSEMLQHAAASVFHYFKDDLERQTVTIGEFTGALEKVLRSFGLTIQTNASESAAQKMVETNLDLFARESADSLELLFFPRLREKLRDQLRQSPRLLRFSGLRGCVKQLAGAHRWSCRCEKMREQIVEYLRGCLTAEKNQTDCALVVE
ncbi:MAG TPA: hypothetical protein VHG71_04125 [Verrucomicrobiae bacterium]|nr:hypothetical protein [Verrucomicrobiae bacterium]